MQDYLAIDLEMTGLHPKKDAMLEVGAARIRSGRVEDTISFFVNPGRLIEPEVSALTGITDDMVADGVTPEAALQKVVDFGGDDIWIGHNIIFDYSFLKQQAVNLKIPFEKQAVDTLKLARRFMILPESKSLESLCEYLTIDREHAHRALDDALATAKLYRFLCDEFEADNEEDFKPRDLIYKPKRETPATERQKNNLMELADYHRIKLDVSLDALTRSEASRLTDQIILNYGRQIK